MKKQSIDKIVRDVYPNLIIDQIISAIKKNEIKPGDKLPPENELVRQFDVGRTSVREALAGLEYMNIIIVENGQIIVNPNVESFYNKKLLYHNKIDKKQRQDLMEVREILEIEFVRLASNRATENDIKLLKQILKSINDLLDKYNRTSIENLLDYDIDQYTKQNIQFHLTIAKATQNTLIERIYGIFKGIILQRTLNIVNLDFIQTTQIIYEKLLKSLELRDENNAVKHMKEYLTFSRKIYEDLEEKKFRNGDKASV